MKVTIKGKDVSLDKGSFVGQGGEGAVYAKGQVAFKIYADPSKMIPVSKIQELSVLTRDNIIRPLDVIHQRKKPVGYTMRYLKKTHPLCQTFTKSFRTRHGLQHSDVLDLVQKMRETVEFIHSQKILVVDMNEMNFLVSQDFKDVFFIDVDSYQTPHFPATAIMESIRDRHCKGVFSEGTDWFSFAVVTFQMFVGIHPYKGKHPDVKDMDERMLKNISVLDKDVKVPAVCQDFSVIPPAFMDWYKAVLEKGERVAPPRDPVKAFAGAIVIARVVGSDNFVITKIKEYDSDIVDYAEVGVQDLVLTSSGTLYANGPPEAVRWNRLMAVAAPRTGNVVQAWAEGGKVKLRNVTRGLDVPCDINAEDVMAHAGAIYAKNKDKFLHVEIVETAAGPQAIPKLVTNVMENATRIFPGVAMQDMLGSNFAFLFPRPGACYQIRTKELDAYKIVDAKLDRNVLVVVGNANGQYDRFIFRFDDAFASYDCRKADDVAYSGINFVALDTGICVMINENEEVGMFSRRKDSTNFKIIDDPAVDGQMTLYTKGARVLFAKGKSLYQIEVKK